MAGFGPSEIEDEFAVGMELQIKRDCTNQPASIVVCQQVSGCPTVFGCNAAMHFQGMEEAMADEGIVARKKGIPGAGVDRGQPVDRAQFQGRRLRQRLRQVGLRSVALVEGRPDLGPVAQDELDHGIVLEAGDLILGLRRSGFQQAAIAVELDARTGALDTNLAFALIFER